MVTSAVVMDSSNPVNWPVEYYTALACDDVDSFAQILREAMPVFKVETFTAAVLSALRGNAVLICKYLKPMERNIANFETKEAYIVELWKIERQSSLRMLLSIIDDKGAIQNDSRGFDQDTADLFVSCRAYFPLYCLWKHEFEILSDDLRRSIGVALYKALANDLWRHPSVPPTSRQYTLLFRYLGIKHPTLGCYILGSLCPFVVLNCPETWQYFNESSFLFTIRFCTQCEQQHVWDAIIMALRFNCTEFLGMVATSFYRTRTVGNSRMNDLAELIIINFPDPIKVKKDTDGFFNFQSHRRWTVLFNKKFLEYNKFGNFGNQLTMMQRILIEIKSRLMPKSFR